MALRMSSIWTADLIADYANRTATSISERPATASDVRWVADDAGLSASSEGTYSQEDTVFLVATIRSQTEYGFLPDTTTSPQPADAPGPPSALEPPSVP